MAKKPTYKNQNIKYSNSDKNYFNNIIKTEKNVSVLNETDIKKDINYYNSSDSQKFEQLNSFPEYNSSLKEILKINNEFNIKRSELALQVEQQDLAVKKINI